MSNPVSVKSPFQMRDWRIIHLAFSNEIYEPDPSAMPQWEIKASKSIEYSENLKYYSGIILLDFKAKIPKEERSTELSGTAFAYFTFSAERSEDNEQKAAQLISINGMTFCLGMLRNFLSSQGDILGIRPRLILPSINLHAFEFEKTIHVE